MEKRKEEKTTISGSESKKVGKGREKKASKERRIGRNKRAGKIWESREVRRKKEKAGKGGRVKNPRQRPLEGTNGRKTDRQ